MKTSLRASRVWPSSVDASTMVRTCTCSPRDGEATPASRAGAASAGCGTSTPGLRSGSGLIPMTGCPSRYLATFATSPSCPITMITSSRAYKNLSLGEEYLADHFPSFPVMPGVLMLQTLVEASAWLLRLTDDYNRSVWLLREVRGVKYGTFVAPGRRLELSVELIKREGDTATLRGRSGSSSTGGVRSTFGSSTCSFEAGSSLDRASRVTTDG